MKKKSPSLFLYTFITVFGGLIVGLNMASISGTIPFIQEYFRLDDMSLGFVVGILTIGCLLGAMLGGRFSDKSGRKNVLFFSATLFVISAVGCALSSSLYGLLIFRLAGGFGVGLISVVVPVYISEILPERQIRTLMLYNQLAIVIGILAAYIMNYSLLKYENNWRWMLGFPFVFSIVYLLFLVILPESPHWLYMKGENNNSSQRIVKPSPDKQAIGKVVLIGSALAALQQITGINVIINYAPTIFDMTGVATDVSLVQSIYVGIVNLVFTFVAVWLTNRVERRNLLLCGSMGMALSLLYLVYTFIVPSANGIGSLVAVLCYIGFFAVSFAPVMWVVAFGNYPARIRSTVLPVSLGISWLCTYLTVQFFPWIFNNLGGAVAFSIFACFSVVTFVFIFIYIPETRSKSLKQIENELGLSE